MSSKALTGDKATPLPARLLLEAVVHKKSDTLGLWHQRFARITSREGRLLITYWLSKEHAGRYPRNPRGQYDLSNCRVENNTGSKEFVLVNSIAVTAGESVIPLGGTTSQVKEGISIRLRASTLAIVRSVKVIVERRNNTMESWHQYQSRLSMRRISIQPKEIQEAASATMFSSSYEIKEEIGRGGFATVFRAVHRETKEEVAVKRVNLSAYEEGERRDKAKLAIANETKVMAIINKVYPDNPNLLKIMGVFEETIDSMPKSKIDGMVDGMVEMSVNQNNNDDEDDSDDDREKFSESEDEEEEDTKKGEGGDDEASGSSDEDEEEEGDGSGKTHYIYIVLELLTGAELFDRLVEKGKYGEKEAVGVFLKLVKAVRDLHAIGIIHRDLKCENIIFDREGDASELKVADFGTSYVLGRESEDIHKEDRIGSPGYHAPEVYRNKYGPEGDVWSLGVILYVLLAGFAPFDSESEGEIMMKVMTGNYEFEEEYWSSISPEAMDLVKGMLTVNMSQRLTIAQVMAHPWFSKKSFASSGDTSALATRMRDFNATRKFKSAALVVTGVTRMKVQRHVMRAVLGRAVAHVANSMSHG